jgi:hypothetical protein
MISNWLDYVVTSQFHIMIQLQRQAYYNMWCILQYMMHITIYDAYYNIWCILQYIMYIVYILSLSLSLLLLYQIYINISEIYKLHICLTYPSNRTINPFQRSPKRIFNIRLWCMKYVLNTWLWKFIILIPVYVYIRLK